MTNADKQARLSGSLKQQTLTPRMTPAYKRARLAYKSKCRACNTNEDTGIDGRCADCIDNNIGSQNTCADFNPDDKVVANNTVCTVMSSRDGCVLCVPVEHTRTLTDMISNDFTIRPNQVHKIIK